MRYKCLSAREAEILAALGRGIIPAGGPFFSLGARHVEDKWLPRADYVLFRMPILTRLGLKIMLRLLEYAWPVVFMKRAVSLRKLSEADSEALLHKVENSGLAGAAALAFIKVIVFPAFYGVEEARRAIDYQPRFPVAEEFESLKQ